MLGVDELNLAMSIAESGILETAVYDLAGRSQLWMFPEGSSIRVSLNKQLKSWKSLAEHRLIKVTDEVDLQRELDLYLQVIHLNKEQFYAQLPDLLNSLQKQNSFFYNKAKNMTTRNGNEKGSLFPRYFCQQWHEELSSVVLDAQKEILETEKERFLQEYYKKIKTFKQMENATDIDYKKQSGRFWDMAAAQLTKGNVKQFKHYAAFLKQHDEIKKIAEKLGRMAGEVADSQQEQTFINQPIVIEEHSNEATDDIVGIHQSNDLSRMIPNETIFLSSPELETVFYKRFAEKRLMNYQIQGKSRKVIQVKSKRPDNKKPDKDKGPFIICVDGSGSMQGFPEQCAKAIAYALMQIALEENRECYVILFSSKFICYEMTKSDGLREISDFLSYQFKGGTDLDSAIIEGLKMMSSGTYHNADMVVISDFVVPKQVDELLEQVERLKNNKNRFHAINLSRYGNPEAISMFDFCWSYHPNLISRLISRKTRKA